MLASWEVALILISLSLIVAFVIGAICRFGGIRNLTSCFASDEEKAVLTKNDHHGNGYMVGSDSDFKLDSSGKFVEYDTVKADMNNMDLNATTQVVYQQQQQQPTPPPYRQQQEQPQQQNFVSVSEVEEYKLQRAVSCDSLASDTSVMELQPDISPIGQLEIGLEYDREVSELVVSIIQAKDLQQNEYTGPIDSYVRVILQPNETKGHTKIQKKTSNPLYKERFLFNVDSLELDRKTVAFQVFSCDKYARHKVIGETEIRMCDLDLYQPIRIWMSLRDIDEKPAELGELMFSLSYLPTAERLTVVVVKGRNFKWTEMKRCGDSMVKVFLLQNGRKISKKRTSLKRDEANPVFNEAMIFSVPPNALQTVQLRFTIAEQIPDGRTPSVGHVIVGASTAGTELSHWNQMMTSLRKPVSMWHNLIRHR
ncbi:synaptotagmin-12-like [Tubulanus polymorphus]|uniref:synaptotagmin-12-like n=1 Tax=Tubulanus polymorphus TaxID=672921 RepID=UPI003DA1FE68